MTRNESIRERERRLLAREYTFRLHRKTAIVLVVLSILALPVLVIIDARTEPSLVPIILAMVVNAMVWFSVALHARARLEHIETIWHHTSLVRWIVKRKQRETQMPRAKLHRTPTTPHRRT